MWGIKVLFPLLLLNLIVLVCLGLLLALIEPPPTLDSENRGLQNSGAAFVSAPLEETETGHEKPPISSNVWTDSSITLVLASIEQRLESLESRMARIERKSTVERFRTDRIRDCIYTTLLVSVCGYGDYHPTTLGSQLLIFFSGVIGIVTIGIIAGIAFRCVEVSWRQYNALRAQ